MIRAFHVTHSLSSNSRHSLSPSGMFQGGIAAEVGESDTGSKDVSFILYLNTLPTKVRMVNAMVFPVVMYGCESWTIKKAQCQRIDVLNCGVGEDSWESLGLLGDQTSQSSKKSILNIHWKAWYWSWSSSTLATWYKEPIHWKRPWCWERLKARGEGDDRG